MGKRQAISYRLRFDVLKRDGFACRYCGQRAPSVVLHVDHATPVAEGGDNDEGNLVSSCSACNFGKGASPPDPPYDRPDVRNFLAGKYPEYVEFLPVLVVTIPKLGDLGTTLTRCLLAKLRTFVAAGAKVEDIVESAHMATSYSWLELYAWYCVPNEKLVRDSLGCEVVS